MKFAKHLIWPLIVCSVWGGTKYFYDSKLSAQQAVIASLSQQNSDQRAAADEAYRQVDELRQNLSQNSASPAPSFLAGMKISR